VKLGDIRLMRVKTVLLGFVVAFFVLLALSTKISWIIFLVVFLIPLFVFLLGKCRCEECGKSYGVFLENLDVRTGKCLSCSKNLDENS
jgi:1,4-dihydroxy-2-naphthoate octaprenyltransferase